jgi:hypothetical protein
MSDPSNALFAFFTEDNAVSMVYGSLFAGLSDHDKLKVLNLATDLILEQVSLVVTSLEVQRTSQAGHRLVQ